MINLLILHTKRMILFTQFDTILPQSCTKISKPSRFGYLWMTSLPVYIGVGHSGKVVYLRVCRLHLKYIFPFVYDVSNLKIPQKGIQKRCNNNWEIWYHFESLATLWAAGHNEEGLIKLCLSPLFTEISNHQNKEIGLTGHSPSGKFSGMFKSNLKTPSWYIPWRINKTPNQSERVQKISHKMTTQTFLQYLQNTKWNGPTHDNMKHADRVELFIKYVIWRYLII